MERMRRLLGEEFPSFAAVYRKPADNGLRVNPLKLSPNEFLAISPYSLEPVPWCPEGFVIVGQAENASEPGKHPYHAAGLYYLQDPSAMAPVEVLDPQPGELVLDLSAAPGGKATMIAGRLGGRGVLIANEIHPKRAWELAENLERWGTRNAAVLNETPKRLADHFGAIFDRMLLDAPCSGEGMFRKSEAARRDWNSALPVSCALRQEAILEEAARLVRPGGRLVYSTCTFSPEENEGVALRFLEAHPEFEPERVPNRPGFSPAHPDWVEPQVEPALANSAGGAMVRLWPHQTVGEGHFIASFRRAEGKAGRLNPQPAVKPGMEAQRLWRDFAAQNLADNLDENGLHQEGAYLYRLPPGLPQLKGLRAIHPGWWLGIFKKNRFEPAHALALGLKANEAKHTLRLRPEEPETAAYLRGESISISGENGWNLVTLDGFPLGWGKMVNGVLKNYYPRGLRWV